LCFKKGEILKFGIFIKYTKNWLRIPNTPSGLHSNNNTSELCFRPMTVVTNALITEGTRNKKKKD
jgi:hypothetical protein